MPSDASPVRVLVLYDSRYVLEDLARAVGEGVDSVDGAAALLRRLDDAVPDDLFDADALILGSPNWSGVTGKMKDWLDRVGDVWADGQLRDKVGAAFTAGASRNAGIEFTLWSFAALDARGRHDRGWPSLQRDHARDRLLLRGDRLGLGTGGRP